MTSYCESITHLEAKSCCPAPPIACAIYLGVDRKIVELETASTFAAPVHGWALGVWHSGIVQFRQ